MSSLSYFEQLAEACREVKATVTSGSAIGLSEGLSQALSIIIACGDAGRKVIFIGNGGSAAIASHQAVDYWKNGGVRAISFNEGSLLTCISNDLGFQHVFQRPIEMFADPGDVLIAISSSGQSENILRGSKAGLDKGCTLITMSGFKPDNPLRSLGRLNFYVASSIYGYVEIAHLALCHCIVDHLISRRV